MSDNKSIHSVLNDVFGYPDFRSNQEEIINHVISNKDSLVIMPTGGGKSLCYQVPAISMEGCAIVISPLLALMKDQVSALQANGVKARALNSHSSREDILDLEDLIAKGELDLLYVSPERMIQESFVNFIKKYKINLIAIDEAHCVSQWGNDFRPDYIKLSILKSVFPHVPLMALTATADQATQDDIMIQLQLDSPFKFLDSFERTNISISCLPGLQRKEQIIRFISDNAGQSGIVYCLSRKNTEKLATDLQNAGFQAECYHAGLSPDIRKKVQEEFQLDTIKIVVATIAFGMGIDKSNIRWVIHYNLPKSIEGYYQEIGRSGRDGSLAKTLLFYSYADFTQLQSFITDGAALDDFKTIQGSKLDRMWQFANATNCRTNIILNYFGEFRKESCGRCDNCINPPDFIDGTTIAQMALSGIARSKGKINLTLLTELLKGTYKPEIIRLGLDKIKTFGVGRDLTYIQWKHYLVQLLNQGIIHVNLTKNSRLELTPLSENVLYNKEKVELTEFRKIPKKAESQLKFFIEDGDYDQSLFEFLRSWRQAMAIQKKVPPFVVFSDKTLKSISSKLPKSNTDLLSISGIGQVKLEQYGKQLLDIVEEYNQEN